jgi:CRP-like cAMP-binding protein
VHFSNKATELTPSQVRSLTERMKVTRFAKGQIIYDGHQPESRVYFISSGIAKLTCLNRDGERLPNPHQLPSSGTHAC